MISYYSFTEVARAKDFRWNEIFDKFAYLFTRCPHFREHRTSRKVHHFSLCLSSSFFFSACHTRKQYRAPCIPADVAIHLHASLLFASTAWHLQLVAAPHIPFSVIQGEFLFAPKTLCFLKVQRVTCKQVFAKPRNWMLHFWQLSLPVVWKHSTQNPQKLVTAWCHHLCIENWIFLDSWRNLIKNMLIRKLQI